MSKLVVLESGHDRPWLAAISSKQKEVADLLGPTEEEQRKSGYFHTLREILQQPDTWLETGGRLASMSEELLETIAGIEALVLTGSGSSEYAGDCVRLPLQNRLRIPVHTIGGGMLLTHGGKAIPPMRPGLMVSLARSGVARRALKRFQSYSKQSPTLDTCSSRVTRKGDWRQLIAEIRG